MEYGTSGLQGQHGLTIMPQRILIIQRITSSLVVYIYICIYIYIYILKKLSVCSDFQKVEFFDPDYSMFHLLDFQYITY